MMTSLWSLLAITLLLTRPVAVSGADADSSLPSPTMRMIVVNGIPDARDAATIDDDTVALLE